MTEEKTLTLGSLFDGSGGFPLGGILAGITPVWASEIEPFTIRVTTRRIPFMKHYGDVSTLDGGKIEPVDIITFGSPCQDMSVAGRRDGLDGSRSSLFYEAVRVIKEMRYATDGNYPRYIVWENVPGAFSSNKGRDFKAVLETIVGIARPGAEVSMPENSRWPYADLYMGDGWSIAYRTLDAQYWGVPQRRRRIYLVADFAGAGAGKILFESEGLSGYSAEGFRSWQGVARSAEACLGASGFDGYNGNLTDEVVSTLGVNCGMSTGRSGVILNDQSGNNVPLMLKIRAGCEGGGKGALIQENKSATLSCNNDQALFDPCGWDGGQISPTLTKQNASGSQRMPDKDNFTCVLQPFGISVKNSNAMMSENPCSGIAAVSSYAAQSSVAVNRQTGALKSNRFEGALPPSSKLESRVCYGIGRDAFNQGKNALYALSIDEDLQPTLVAKGPGAVQSGYAVRRLTPTECARLQGFPDWWCSHLETETILPNELAFWRGVFDAHSKVTGCKRKTDSQIITWLRKPHSDAAEYKMWGNGVALPCVWFVLSGIAWYDHSNGS